MNSKKIMALSLSAALLAGSFTPPYEVRAAEAGALETQEFGSEAVKEGTSGDTVVTWEDEGPLTDVTVIVPKNVPLGKDTKAADYEVTVKGNIRYDEKVTVAPEDDIADLEGTNFYMSQTSAVARAVRPDVPATVVQDATEWMPDEVTVDGTVKSGTISVPGLTFGSWEGNMTFLINLGEYAGEHVHNYVDGKCEKCGADEPEEHKHSYSEEITKAATCTESGEITLTCSCGDMKVETVPATGHNYIDGKCTKCYVVDVPAVAPAGAIDDWQYSIKDGNIVLEYYLSAESKPDVIVYDEYELDGAAYPSKIGNSAFFYNDMIKSVRFGENVKMQTEMSSMFSDCSALTYVNFGGLDTSNVTRMDSMFSNCSALTNVDWGSLDTSNVTRMDWMFSDCPALTNVDLDSLDTRNVVRMDCMFKNCSNIGNINLSCLNTGNVMQMDRMFEGCSALTYVDLSNLDTHSLVSVECMFSDCCLLTNINLSGFDTSSVTSMCGMLSGCSSLASIDLSGFTTEHVTDMSGMFSNCSSLMGLDLSSFDTSNVVKMSGMFECCSSLANVDLSSFDTHNVETMPFMFNGCSSLVKVDLCSFDTNNVTSMFGMFSGCSKLDSVKVTMGRWTLSASDIDLADGVLQYN